MNLRQAIWAVLTAGIQNVGNLVATWTPAALRSLALRLSLMLGYSVVIMVITLGVSIIFEIRWIMPIVGILYLAWMVVLLACWQTLQAAGLLAAFDLAVDAAKHGKPITLENIGGILTLSFDFERVKELTTLKTVAYAVFWMTMLECVIFAIFSFVPVWAHWELLAHIAFFSIVYRLLCTPWGEHSMFGKLKPIILMALVLMGAYYASGEVKSLWAWFNDWDPLFFSRFNLNSGSVWYLVAGLVVLGLLLGNGKSGSASNGH